MTSPSIGKNFIAQEFGRNTGGNRKGRSNQRNVTKRRETDLKISVLQQKIEMELRIKSRCLWLKEGDQNSSFFHYQCKECSRRNTIKELTLGNGDKINDPELIKKEVKSNFQELYSTEEEITLDDMLTLSREIPHLL